MSGHGPTLKASEIPELLAAPAIALPKRIKVFLWVLIAAALLTVMLGIAQHNRLIWITLQVNFTYWFCLAAALTVFSAVFQICNAEWARPIRRLFESGSNFLLLAWIPLLLLYFGKGELFVWVHTPIEGKEGWLSPIFLYVRDIVAIFLLAGLGQRLVSLSLRRDKAAQNKVATRSSQDGLTSRMGRLSPVIVIVYAFVMTLIAFDQIMSVDPHWYSTLFGAFYFMSAGYLALAWVCMSVLFVRRTNPLLAKKITPDTMHDLGKLLFGFGIFWAYLFWSHYLPVWYGNIPEFTGWVIDRLRLEPWHSFAWIVFGSCFIVPFLIGLSREVKRIPECLFLLGLIVAVGLWLQMYLLFVPTLYPTSIPIGMHDALVSVGFAAAFVLSSSSFLKKVPLMPFGDLSED